MLRSILQTITLTLLACNFLQAQDVFQPSITAQDAPGRYNAKGERLSNRSPKHVRDNADKTHFTFTQWAEKIEEAKRPRDKENAAKQMLGIVGDFGLMLSDSDIQELRTCVPMLFASDSPVSRATAIEIVFLRFRKEFQNTVVAGTKDESPLVRARSLRALSDRPVPGSNDVFGNVLSDRKEDKTVRLYAARALSYRLSVNDFGALDHLQAGLKANRDAEIRKVIEDALAKHYARTN